MEKNLKVSICIPIHSMADGEWLLERCLDSVIEQSYQNYEVVVTDNSTDSSLFDVLSRYVIPKRYAVSIRKGMAQNTNEAIKHATGDIIKILYMDDLFAHKDALKEIVEAFTGSNKYWLVTACEHTHGKDRFNKHKPVYTDDILTANTIGSPSVLAFRNDNPLFFDEKMTWLLDADLYHRLHKIHGEPMVINKTNVVIGIHKGQMTNILSNKEKQNEEEYIKEKHA